METRTITIEKLEEELRTAGFTVDLKEVEVVKNAVVCKGIRVDSFESPSVSPIIYYNPTDTIETVFNRIVGVLSTDYPPFELEKLTDPAYFAEHVYLSVGKQGGTPEGALAMRYLNLDVTMFLVVRGSIEDGEYASTKVNESLLEMLGITQEQAWQMAADNSRKTAQIGSIMDFLGLPDDIPLCCLPDGITPGMYVAAANAGHGGACVICFPDVFREFMESGQMESGVKSLVLIPSSTEEIIFIPETDRISVTDILEMVEDINSSIVEPKLQLEPAVYRYSLETNEISLVAELGKGAMA